MAIWKQLLILSVLAGISYGGYEAYLIYSPQEVAASERRAERPVTVELAVAEIRTMEETIEAVGTTRAARSVEIVPEADGRVVELSIIPGAQVTKGTVLVRLDDAIERADLAEAEARVTEQQQTLQRMQQLRSTNAVSQASVEEVTARLAEAEAQLDRAKQRLLNRTISAPFDGVAGLSDIDLGARVNEGDRITRLDDLAQVEVEFSLPETLFARISKDLPISARSAAFSDRVFVGAVASVDSRIDPVSRSFRTRAVIPNPDRTLPAGMFMSLTLTLSRRDALVVPEEAVIFQAAETYVFTIEDGTAKLTRVRTSARRDGYIVVEEGITEGEPIVIKGLQRVRDGRKVEVLNAPGVSVGAGENES